MVDRKALRDILTTYFSMDDLRDLCFDLNVDYEEIQGESKPTKVLHLIQYFENRSRYDELVNVVARLRPNRFPPGQFNSSSASRPPVPAPDLSNPSPSAPSSKTIKILFLAANPTDTTRLRLDQESRAIDEALRKAAFRHFDVEQHWAVRVGDLQELLLRHKPHVVHFSGHGSADSEIILENNNGEAQPVPARALARLFSVLKGNIRCVVLNGCYSEGQAQAIAEHIDCVIGMSKAIGDTAAISFATSFYRALGFGENVQTAFALGCVEIELHSLDEQDTPKLLALKHDPQQIVFAGGE